MSLLINTHRTDDPAMTIAIEPQGEIGPEEDATLLRDRFVMVLAATRPEHIVVDLGAVPSISEAGFRALHSGYEKAAADDTRMTIVNSKPAVYGDLSRHGLSGLATGPDRRPDM